MRLDHLWLKSFRSFPTAELECPDGVCVLRGRNGVGKTNVLEAIGYLSDLRSFRGSPAEALVGRGTDRAVVRGRIRASDRCHLVEAEISLTGRNRVLLDRQRPRSGSSLAEIFRVTVFSPDDLELIKGGPGPRRSAMDELAAAAHPRNGAVRAEWDKALRQRNALLRQARGRLDEAARTTLEVWDAKLTESGERVASTREDLITRLGPELSRAYRDLGGDDEEISIEYERSWEGDLGDAMRRSREEELRRGITLVGPQRDEISIELNGLPARTHASQGEQRCLALALRLAGHRELDRLHGEPPVLLLDDVFSELDPVRGEALVAALPPGQAFLSTATDIPAGVVADAVVEVTPGELRARSMPGA